ncbi:MAG: hypothetical protein Q8891_01195 [Bacteroidota bacterium]|nr:hypothetical protein [Bacteroidota bacterium]
MKDKTQEKIFSRKYINLLCRIVFTLILIDLSIAGLSNTLTHQLQAPVLKYPYVDPTFWIMHLLRIPEFISSNFYFAWGLDISLFASCIGVLLFPQKKLLITLFIVSYFFYYIIFNSFSTHHNHFQIPVLIVPIAFLFSGKAFTFSWEGLRYFCLFTYSGAFFWKLFRLSWLNPEQGILIVKKNLTPYLYFNPGSLLSNIYNWLLRNPLCLEIMFLTGFAIEGAFIVGFFTKKFDKYLLVLSLILPIGFWFFADVPFFAQVILSLTLLHINPKYLRGENNN